MSAEFRFNAMYFLPYIHLPRNHKTFKSTWVDFPNKYYDPEKVANQLGEWALKAGTNHFNNVMHVADMPHSKTVRNLTLFAQEVIPRLRSTLRLSGVAQ